MSSATASRLLVLIAILLAFPSPVYSSEEDVGEIEDFAELDLEEMLEVVFTAAKHEQDIADSPSAITVISREDIQASGATTIVDLLRLVPGMDVIVSTPVHATMGARMPWNFEGQHFLVLIDGREANMELLGYPPWELQPILFEDIERIEIIRGPGSCLYGANAMAGVISVTTRMAPEGTNVWMGLSSGEVATHVIGARISSRIGDWGISASGGIDYSGTPGNPRFNGRDIWKFRLAGEYKLTDERRLMAEGGFSEGGGLLVTGVGPFDANVSLRTLRLAYQSEDLSGHLYWRQMVLDGHVENDLIYNQLTLAEFLPLTVDTHTLVAEVQWTPPRFWEPLLLIVGAGGRFAYLSSDQLLDADEFNDPNSPGYQKEGVDHLEGRGGVFIHGELTPADWVTVTGGMRFDYNSITGTFLSPRLAAVFRPVKGQFFRIGAARAFRKPAYIESGLHLSVEIPEGSPITDEDGFRQFMTRVLGNSDLDNEQLYAFEVGYLGRFLENRLTVSLNLYYNLYINEIVTASDIKVTSQGLPDLIESTYMFDNMKHDTVILGGELSVSFKASKRLTLHASWSHRESYEPDTGFYRDSDPKNLITLGGRLRTESGLLGSLYVFTRSEFWDRWVYNPDGMLEDILHQHMDNTALVLGKLGWRFQAAQDFELEAGVKLFLPVSPFSSPHFKYRDKGGGLTHSGGSYGGIQLQRMVTGYLEGTF